MLPAKTLLTLSLASIAGPAIAGVSVIGATSARLCYEAAEAGGMHAIPHCDKALNEEALSPSDAVATLVNRGILRLRKNQIAEAVADFDAAIARDPEEAEAYLNKGVALMRGDASEGAALPLFTMALQKKTAKPGLAYLARGMAYERLGDLKAAYLDYRRASAADPKWEQPRLELARFTVR